MYNWFKHNWNQLQQWLTALGGRVLSMMRVGTLNRAVRLSSQEEIRERGWGKGREEDVYTVKNWLAVLTTEWLPWLQTSWGDSGCTLVLETNCIRHPCEAFHWPSWEHLQGHYNYISIWKLMPLMVASVSAFADVCSEVRICRYMLR